MRLPRPRHGTVVAYLALFAALGGTSYAATKIGTSDIQRQAVTKSKIAPNSITSSKVRNHSLRAVDFQPGSLPEGPQGPQGPQGPAGPAGPPGPVAAVGFANVAEDGTVNASQSQGIGNANIIHHIQGGYCFVNLPSAPRNVQVTPVNSFNGPVTANVTLGQFGQCPVGTQVTVVLTANANGAAVNNGFFITID